MNELYHLEGDGEEVEASFDLMVTDCLVGLGHEVVFRTGGVTVTVVTMVGVCLIGGAPDPLEGSSPVLGLLLRPWGASGGVC